MKYGDLTIYWLPLVLYVAVAQLGRMDDERNDTKMASSPLQKRLDMPMGETPAARVIRRSARPVAASPRKLATVAPERKPPPPPTVLGLVMERPRRARREREGTVGDPQPHSLSGSGSCSITTSCATTKNATSRFLQSAQQSPPKTGFPSLEVPLGTFSGPHPVAGPVRAPTLLAMKALTKELGVTASSLDDDTRTAAQRDAQALLAAMSPAEIQESARELSATLDPATLAFLRQRSRRRTLQQQPPPPSATSTKEPPNEARGHAAAVTDPHEVPKPSVAYSAATDKRKLAHVLSSIRNYDDLDAAYQAHMDELEDPADVVQNAALDHGCDQEFTVTCELLRSTSPQQTLWAARAVCRRLVADLEKDPSAYSLVPLSELPSRTQRNVWPYPTLLPVSLRCLLDVSVSHRISGILQTTYVLQSLYTLLQLRACADHVVDVTAGLTLTNHSDAVFYQVDCLDDAVPALPVSVCYAAAPAQPVTASGDRKDLGGEAYTTLSSSTSARVDGEAFLRDPMWTLLSKMRVLPRLAELLREGNISDNNCLENRSRLLLPVEALIATCGILTMIGQRSPGAASAIVQHPTLLDDLISLTFVRRNGSARYDPASTLPTVRLMCTLARQSRAAANGLCRRLTELSFLPQTLSLGRATSGADFELQQWTMVLWRTLVRYGLCLDALPSMLTLAAPHLTLGLRDPRYSLASEMYTSFAGILRCVLVLKLQPESVVAEAISSDQRTILANATAWLSSLTRPAVMHLNFNEKNCSLQNCESLRFVTSILHYLHAWLSVSRDEALVYSSGRATVDGLSESEALACIAALATMVQSAGSISAVVAAALSFALCPDFDATVADASLTSSIRFEACACAFLEGLVALVVALLRMNEASDDLRRRAANIADDIRALLVSTLEALSERDEDPASRGKAAKVVGTARRHWLNRAHASVVIFLHETQARSLGDDRKLTRAIAFAVIGRLGCGDERTAALLFSFHDLFHVGKSRCAQPSLVSTLLVRELRRTQRSRNQCDHSFRLHFELGISSDSLGPFDAPSLLSEAENLSPPSRDADDNLLPIGQYWLWKLLSGSATLPYTPDKHGECETADVLLSTLLLIQELELESESCVPMEHKAHATGGLNLGAKLYYLANVSLHDERILSQDQIISVAENMFDRMFFSIRVSDVTLLAEECRKHLDPRPIASEADSTPPLSTLSNQEKVMAFLEPVDASDELFSAATIRSLEAFVGDLCDIYLDYGAHYTFFTKCVRLFLANGFPTKIRCLVIQRLRGALHLLTLEDDLMTTVLRSFIAGGAPSVDESWREAPELIDCLAVLFPKGTLARPDDVFVAAWATGVLARSLAIGVLICGTSGHSASRRRLCSLEPSFALRVVRTAALWLATDCTLDSLVTATLADYVNQNELLPLHFSSECFHRDGDWEQTIALLLAAKNL